jgi:hypothetical protein
VFEPTTVTPENYQQFISSKRYALLLVMPQEAIRLNQPLTKWFSRMPDDWELLLSFGVMAGDAPGAADILRPLTLSADPHTVKALVFYVGGRAMKTELGQIGSQMTMDSVNAMMQGEEDMHHHAYQPDP